MQQAKCTGGGGLQLKVVDHPPVPRGPQQRVREVPVPELDPQGRGWGWDPWAVGSEGCARLSHRDQNRGKRRGLVFGRWFPNHRPKMRGMLRAPTVFYSYGLEASSLHSVAHGTHYPVILFGTNPVGPLFVGHPKIQQLVQAKRGVSSKTHNPPTPV